MVFSQYFNVNVFIITFSVSTTDIQCNMSVVSFSKNNKTSGGSKLIEIKYLVARDKIKDGVIVVKHIILRQ